jgi:hypothetical protein
MRISMLFPPAICLPNQVYYSLPLFAAVLKRAGHEVRAIDLNLIAADLLLDDRTTQSLWVEAGGRLVAQARARSIAEAETVRANLERNLPLVAQGEACKRALRDPVRFYDQPKFRHAFWTIVDILAAYYQLDPVISPFRATFARDLRANQQADAWTTMRELYDRGLLDEALAGDPEVIGLTIAFPEQAVESIRLLRRIRQRAPHVRLVVGGPLVGGFADAWLADGLLLEYCDYVVLGDGETAFVELLEAIAGRRSHETVRNLVWRDARGVVRRPLGPTHLESLDELPVPDFGAIDMARYFLPEPIYPLMLSRGCYWGRCTFCSIGWRENYRMAAAEKIRADVTAVARRYGGRFVQLQDSSVPPKAAHHLGSAIRDEGLDVHWTSSMKFERCILDAGYCNHLGGAGGCRSLHMGFESSDQRLLDLMQKGYEIRDLPRMLDNLRAAGISAELLWFIGFPTQTRRDVLDTAQYLYDHRDRFGLTSFVGDYYLHPDTEVFERPQDFGVTVTGMDNDHCIYVVRDGISQAEAAALKRMLASNNNRTLICNGSHLPHVAVTGHVRGLERAIHVPPEVIEFCTRESATRS